MTIYLTEIVASVVGFVRVGGIYFALPIFGDQPTPIRVRILLSVVTTYCLLHLVIKEPMALPESLLGFFSIVVKELSIGLLIGYVARLAFSGLTMAATFVGYQMGFGTANLMMPDVQIPMDGFTAFHRVLMIIIFFSLNLHHIYLRAIGSTFDWLPLGMTSLPSDLGPFLISASAQTFKIALELAGPVLVGLMFTMGALGLIARTVPQLNIFSISFPVSFFVGLIIYLSIIPLFIGILNSVFSSNGELVYSLIQGMAR